MTFPQLTSRTSWAEIQNPPVKSNQISVRHEGTTKSVLTNQRGPALIWRATLPGSFDVLMLNGKRMKATQQQLPVGRNVSWVRVAVAPGNSVTVEAPAAK